MGVILLTLPWQSFYSPVQYEYFHKKLYWVEGWSITTVQPVIKLEG
jgi:hypothetical protein